jgi:hypothetical protein
MTKVLLRYLIEYNFLEKISPNAKNSKHSKKKHWNLLSKYGACRNRDGEELGLCNWYTSLYFLSVTSCGRAAKAPELPREDIDGFDPVVNDAYMPDMDGFKLLELVGLEMDLPIISEFLS